jgi:restriction system protein
LRQRGLPLWGKDDPQARKVRAVGKNNPTDQADAKAYDPWLTHADPAVVANALICLIHQTNYLLDRQIAGLEKQFIEEGGYSERLHAARLQERQRQFDPTDQSDQSDEPCPACGKLMVLRTARKGPNAGSQFLGCSGYPECKMTLQRDTQ